MLGILKQATKSTQLVGRAGCFVPSSQNLTRLSTLPIILQSVRTYASEAKINDKKAETTKKEEESDSSSSLFGSLTPNVSTKDQLVKEKPKSEKDELEDTTPGEISYVAPKDDKKLQEYLHPKPYKTVNSLLSPLKRRLYLDNVKKNGFFKNGDRIKLPDGSVYSMKLTREVIEALEPSIYLRSWRMKSSVKKTNPVLRALKNLPLKKAITQLHFMQKKVARELAEMLERGLKDAESMKYDPNKIYVAESWVHFDGSPLKRVECKGRGRSGIIVQRFVSVRFLLKTNQTLKRLKYEENARKNNKPVKSFLTGQSLRGPVSPFYKW